MMGAGKSTVGKELAARSGRPFSDTDVLLQNRFGRRVSDIFRTYGESAFRDHETSILRGMTPGAHVLATGGGIVLRDQNWTEMRRLGTTVFIDVAGDVVKGRLAHSKKKRPLLAVDQWEQQFDLLMDQRRELYEQADLIVPIGTEEPSMVVDRILRALESQE